jgi:hypothetical protein
MKKILLTLALLAAVTVRAQYGITVDGNCVIVRGTNFFNANSNLWQTPIIGWINNQKYISSLQTNIVYSSQQYVLFSTNAFMMSGSNFIGTFPQLYNWVLVAPFLAFASPFQFTEQLWGSYSGTNNWFLITNGFMTFTNISLSVVSTNSAGVGTVTLYGIDHPEQIGHVVSLDGQFLLHNGSPIADQAYVNNYVHVMAPPVQMAGSWVLDSQYTNGDTVTFYNHGVAIFQLMGYAPLIARSYGGMDGTRTNMLINTAVTNLVPGWVMEVCTNLSPPIAWSPATYTLTTNSGVATFALPIYKGLLCQFFNLRNSAAQTAAFTIPVTMPALLLTPTTITNSSSPAAGVGLICADTNYIYVSVATNQWHRAALSAW